MKESTMAVFLVFLVLKLVGIIHWSWWWVTAPLWGGSLGVVGILILWGLFKLIASFWKKK